jgi:hypothetical protein
MFLTDHFRHGAYEKYPEKALAVKHQLAALVPKPRVNLTRFHGVFAPNSKHRATVKPAKPGKGDTPKVSDKDQKQSPAERRASITWAQRLKEVSLAQYQ